MDVKVKVKVFDPSKISIMDYCYMTCLKSALLKTDGKLSLAAKMLGLSNVTARKHAKRLGLWPIKNR